MFLIFFHIWEASYLQILYPWVLLSKDHAQVPPARSHSCTPLVAGATSEHSRGQGHLSPVSDKLRSWNHMNSNYIEKLSYKALNLWFLFLHESGSNIFPPWAQSELGRCSRPLLSSDSPHLQKRQPPRIVWMDTGPYLQFQLPTGSSRIEPREGEHLNWKYNWLIFS